MAIEGKQAFWLGFGFFSGAGVALCISELRKRIREKYSTRQSMSEIQDSIALRDLAALARSPNISLKRSAEQIILERAMKDENLEFILSACTDIDDELQVLKGVTVVGVLVKSAEFRSKLIAFKVIETLAFCLDYSIDPGYKDLEETGGRHVKVQRVITSALFDLICDDDGLKDRLGNATPNIIKSILHLMGTSRSKEVIRWSIFVTHQLSLCDKVRPKLLEETVISIAAQVLVRNQGDNILMRLCLQTLVMCANSSEEGEIQALHEMAQFNIIQPTVACLKSDDSDLVYWATALIHEYSVKDLYRSQICAIPNIIKILQGVLATSEAILQRIVLRVISFLCLGDQKFQSEVLNCNSIISKLTVCFASGDPDVVHWAVVLLHDLLLSSGSSGCSSKELAERMINVSDNIIRSLVSLTDRKDNSLIRVVAEVIGFFCSVDFPSETLQKRLITDGALEAVIAFLQSSDPELQIWSSALLLNLCMTSDSVKEEIIRLGGIKPLIELVISESDHHPLEAQSAKTLVMLGFVDHSVPVNLEISKSEDGYVSRIIFDKKKYCFEKTGINICVLDFLTFKITDVMSFDTGHDKEAAGRMVDGLAAIPYGALVFVLCSGFANTYMTFQATEALREIGINKYNFKNNELWAYVGQKREGKGEQIAIHRNNDTVLLQAEISLGRYVNELVLTNLLLPIIELMMSTPPSSAISKVAELELLTIMARHDDHKQVMVLHKGFLKYLSDLCWNISSNSFEYLHEHPMFIAHCIGALKIMSSISISEGFHEELLNSEGLGAVLTLLYFVNEVALVKANQTTADQMSSCTQTSEHVFEQTTRKITSLNCAQFPGTPRDRFFQNFHSAEDLSFDERKRCLTPVTQSESSSTPEDFEDAFCTIVRLAMITIYNCMVLFAGIEESRDSLFKSGTLETIWCTLLTSNETTLAQIGLPAEALLNCFGSMGISEKGILDNIVELDDRVKTSALILSADHLEVYNPNWTFESIRATTYIGKKKYVNSTHPDGWYYEVTLKSNGILQIGWQTEGCRYGPEKGVGVGDDYSSCAFDGARCKVWNGPASDHHENDYGSEWQYGDVLSCLFSWTGDVSFWLNGVNQGVAFSNMNMYLNWYPAASLAMDQHCVFNFGKKPFRYPIPQGYSAIYNCGKACDRVSSPRVSCWAPLSQHFDFPDTTYDTHLSPEYQYRNTFILDDKDSPKYESQDEDSSRAESEGDTSRCFSDSDNESSITTSPIDVKSQNKISVSEFLSENKLESEDSGVVQSPQSAKDESEVAQYSKDGVEGETSRFLKSDRDQPSEIARPLSKVNSEEVGCFQQEIEHHAETTPVPKDDTVESQAVQSQSIGVDKLTADRDIPTNDKESCEEAAGSPEPSVFMTEDGQSLDTDNQPSDKHTSGKPLPLPSLTITLTEDPLSPSTFERASNVDPGLLWLQFSPGECLSAKCDTPSFPCFYFEAELKNAPSKVKQMGFFCTKTGRKIYCEVVDTQLFLPTTSRETQSSQECYRSPDVVGCGILWPAGIVFFTLDGVGTGKYYQFPSDTLKLNDLFPYISCSRISCNYGQRMFLFEGANVKEVKYAGANLCHSHGLSSEITHHDISDINLPGQPTE